ncbi:MAG: TlpA disulfide reductase family protein [Gammaproteobacteria bacterium]
MRHRRVIIILALLIPAGAVTLFWLNDSRSAAEQAPGITFSLIDGSRVELDALRGQPVMVHFWATTCRECRREIPELGALHRDLSPRGLEFIAVAMPYDPPNRVLEVAERTPLPYPVALDIDGTAVRAFGDVSLTPTTFLISPKGEIVYRKTGPLDFKQLRNQIEDLLATKQRATSHESPATGGPWLVAGGS